VVRALFRGKLLALLRDDLENDRLVLPDGVSKVELERPLRRLHSKTWNVRLQQRYAHRHGVIEYLARYVRGGPSRTTPDPVARVTPSLRGLTQQITCGI